MQPFKELHSEVQLLFPRSRLNTEPRLFHVTVSPRSSSHCARIRCWPHSEPGGPAPSPPSRRTVDERDHVPPTRRPLWLSRQLTNRSEDNNGRGLSHRRQSIRTVAQMARGQARRAASIQPEPHARRKPSLTESLTAARAQRGADEEKSN